MEFLGKSGLAHLLSILIKMLSDKINRADVSIPLVKEELFSAIYPIGSIFMSLSPTTPSELFGGVWEQVEDTFLLAAGSTYEAGTTGGEAEHTLIINEMPSHRHAMKTDIDNDAYNVEWPAWTEYTTGYTQDSGITQAPATHTASTGGSQPHNNMPPYLAVYVWKRVS